MSDALITAIIGTLGAVLLAIVGLYGARKFKIGDAQEKLVNTLQALVEAQDKKIKELTDALEKANVRIAALEEQVETLKTLTINQALEIKDNKDQLETLSAPKPTTRRRMPNA